MNRFFFTLLGCSALLIISCSHSPEPVEIKKLENKNPISYLFDVPEVALRDTVIKLFDISPQMDNPILNRIFIAAAANDKYKMEVMFHPETSSKPVFGTEYFKDKTSGNDIYLTTMGGFWESPIYFHDGKPFEITSDFAFIFKQVNAKQTLLTVRVINPRIVNGTTCCGPHGNYAIMEKVEPSTIEEYTLITYIAKKLKVKNLKPVELPK